jgi:D-amino-acid dehydrogenase
MACGRKTHLLNRRRMQRLGVYSRQRLDALSRGHRLEYEQARGYMILYRHAQELARARRGLPLLAELGVAHELLEPLEARAHEPALSAQAPLHGALYLPADLVGNCRQFAHVLKAQAQDLGAQFRFGAEVTSLSKSHAGGLYWRAADRPDEQPHAEAFDGIVLCTGMLAPALGAKLGLKLPIVPIFGYSMTAAIRQREGEPDPGPKAGVMDERYKVAITRLGQRIRVAGIAEVGGDPELLRDAPIRTLYKVLDDWYPGAADYAKVQHWKGARPMLPDGPPLIGRAGPQRLWLNLGHGSSGWALACGSARVLADLLAGRTPDIDIEGLGIERLR